MSSYKNYKEESSQENSLQYKEHSEFFVKYFELRTKCTFLLSSCRIDKIKTPLLQIAMYDLITWTNSQLSKVTDMDTIYKEMKDAEDKIKEKKLDNAFNKLNNLFDKISVYHSEAELLPKVYVQEKDLELSSLDDKTRYALEAWRIVYAQK